MPAELAITLAATDDDRLLQAESLVRDFCGWHVAPSRTETVTLDGDGSALLLLASLLVTDVTVVTADGTALVADTDYLWSSNGWLRRVGGCWPSTEQSVTVTFTHGYDTVPAVVEAVVQAVAQRALDNPGSRPREQAGPFADTYSQSGFNQAPALALLDAEKSILDRYRLPSRP